MDKKLCGLRKNTSMGMRHGPRTLFDNRDEAAKTLKA